MNHRARYQLILLSLCMGIVSSALALDNIGVSQGYYISDTGRPVTIKSEVPQKNSGWSTLYSPDGFFYQDEMVEIFGSKYIIMEETMQVHTLDSRGEFYKSMSQFADSKIKERGSNFFVTRKGTLNIVKTNGELIRHEDNKKFKRLRQASGMLLQTRNKNVYIANPISGKLDDHGKIDLGDIIVRGDNYFITEDSTLYTIGFEPLGDSMASVINEVDYPQGMQRIEKAGGNFFFDQNNKIHTINDRGELNNSSQSNMLISDHEEIEPPHIGSNFFSYENGNLFLVDEFGAVNFIEKRADKIMLTNR